MSALDESDWDDWECEIKIRRKGRLVKKFPALGESASRALYYARTNAELWADDQEQYDGSTE